MTTALLGSGSCLHANRRLYSLIVSLLPLFLTGCLSVPVAQVQFSVDAAIVGQGIAGTDWTVFPRDFTPLPPPPHTNPSVGFPIMEYAGKEFGGTYWVFEGLVGGRIRNRTQTTVCVRFDQATLHSSSVSEKKPLRVRLPLDPRERAQLNSSDYKKMLDAGFIIPPSFCVAGGNDRVFNLAIDAANIFRAGTMFDARWKDNEPVILEKGIGNWLKLSVPIEYGELRQRVEVTLTVKDTKSHMVHF
ncbi:MAG: hypothetical protein H7232_17230 [Aeromicrobium sp.]|nr:hypothetical protein [Burkholderiales bacterium]